MMMSRTSVFAAMTLAALAWVASGCGGAARSSSFTKDAPPPAVADAAPATSGSAANPYWEQAEALWAKRDDEASLKQAIDLYEKSLQNSPDDAKVLTRLARAYYLLADGHYWLKAQKDPEKKELLLTTHEKGLEYSERALKASSPDFARKAAAGQRKIREIVNVVGKEGQEPLYWYASNLGRWARAKGFSTVLFHKEDIFQVMKHVLELDAKFFHAAPHRYFGAYYAVAPAFAGGDLKKSQKHFERALELEPDYLGTKVLYADTLAPKLRDKDLYVKLLNEVLAGDTEKLPDVAPENRLEKKKAEWFLSLAEDRF
ncbi:MAG: hypothetical protein GMKNLPBB_03190 [Myxococcota bacterium]|nr:hypothetical protein [Myxococcota bacterium]